MLLLTWLIGELNEGWGDKCNDGIETTDGETGDKGLTELILALILGA